MSGQNFWFSMNRLLTIAETEKKLYSVTYETVTDHDPDFINIVIDIIAFIIFVVFRIM